MSDLGPFPGVEGHDEAQALDAADPLAGEREKFRLPDPDLIYLDGNSLGMLPTAATHTAAEVVEHQWGERLIRSWREGWWDLQLEIGNDIARIIGARPGEVIVSDSTSVNLFKLAVAALRARPGRTAIITDDLNFPSDLYVLDGVAALLEQGHRLEVVASTDGINGPAPEAEAALDDDTALVSLSATCYKSAYTYDVAHMTEAAHAAGALTLWDLSHTAGSVDVDVTAAGVDLAVGCTYKYLNGGPGSPAFLYVRQDLQEQLDNPITAWWAHRVPFAMDLAFEPTETIRRFHTGTMPVVSLAVAGAGIKQVAEVGITAIRHKSVALSEFFIRQTDRHLAPLGFQLASPRDAVRRGSHVSLAHPQAWQIVQAMIEHAAVLPDFREPNVARFGLSPLTTRFMDVHSAIVRIRHLVETGLHEQFGGERAAVT